MTSRGKCKNWKFVTSQGVWRRGGTDLHRRLHPINPMDRFKKTGRRRAINKICPFSSGPRCPASVSMLLFAGHASEQLERGKRSFFARPGSWKLEAGTCVRGAIYAQTCVYTTIIKRERTNELFYGGRGPFDRRTLINERRTTAARARIDGRHYVPTTLMRPRGLRRLIKFARN